MRHAIVVTTPTSSPGVEHAASLAFGPVSSPETSLSTGFSPGTSTARLVRGNQAEAVAEPDLVDVITAFDPGGRPAAIAAHRWLVDDGLRGESVPYLWIDGDEMLGFFALSMGVVELRSQHRKTLQPPQRRSSQPAVLLTWIVKTPRKDVDGKRLLLLAVGLAAEAAQTVAATVIALDPYDAATAKLWADRFGMRKSQTAVPGSSEEPPLKRMFLKLP